MSTINHYVQGIGDRLAGCFGAPPAKAVEEGKRSGDSPSAPTVVKVQSSEAMRSSLQSLKDCWTNEIVTIRNRALILTAVSFFTGGVCYVLNGLPFISILGKIFAVVPICLGVGAFALYRVEREMQVLRLSLEAQLIGNISFDGFMTLFRRSVHNVQVHVHLVGFLLNKELTQLPTYLEATVRQQPPITWDNETPFVKGVGKILNMASRIPLPAKVAAYLPGSGEKSQQKPPASDS